MTNLRNQKPTDQVRSGSDDQQALQRGSEGRSGVKCEDTVTLRPSSIQSISQVSPSVKPKGVPMTKEEIREVAALLKAELDPEWLTEAQVCARIQVSGHWIRANRSRLNARLVPGNKKGWRYRKDSVDAAMTAPFGG